MMVTDSRNRKYAIEELGDILRVSIPSTKNTWSIFSRTIWLAMWSVGGALALRAIISGEASDFPILWFLILWIVIWAIAEISVFLWLLWQLVGKEVIEISPDTITIWMTIPGIRGRTKRYSASDIKALRESASTQAGGIAFDYGAATVTFGKGLTADGAEMIIASIMRRFPQYQSDRNGARVQPESYAGTLSAPLRTLSEGIMPPAPRYRSEVSGNMLRVTIPSPKDPLTIIFLAFWLAFWSGAGAWALRGIISGEAHAFFKLWIVFWALGETAGIYHLLWQLVGKEVIEITPGAIAIRRPILGIGKPKVYRCEQIRRLMIDAGGQREPYARSAEGMSLDQGNGLIALECTSQWIRFGIGLSEIEAKQLIAEIQRRCPQFVYIKDASGSALQPAR